MVKIVNRLLGLRRRYMVGAGVVASALGIYGFAGQLGLVPANVAAVVQSLGQQANKALGPAATLGSARPPGPANGPSSPVAGPSTSFSSPSTSVTRTSNTASYQPSGSVPANYGGGDIACLFSPRGGCTEAVVNEIRRARQQIFVQAYSFTSQPISGALVEAHQRGVQVFIVLDKSQRTEQYSGADFVANAGIPTLIDAAHAIAHNKIMLIDGQTIITGSFNFTKNAEENNAENLLIIRGRPDLYYAYEMNFRHHYEHSQPYQGRGVSGPVNRGSAPNTAGRITAGPAGNLLMR